MNANDVRTLYAYNSWANRRVLVACRTLDSAAFTRIVGGSFGSVKDTLAHIAWAEWIWLERWNHRSPKQATLSDAQTLDGIARAFDETEKRRQSFIAGLTDDRLQERIAYENLKGERWEYSLGHMLQHVVNHSTYHRGQIITLLRQLGAAGVSTDFLLYFDEGHQPQQ